MKKLNFHAGKDEDSLWFTFKGAFNPQAPWESELAPFFDVLEQYSGEWMPDVVEGKRGRKYSRAAIRKALEEGRDDGFTHLGLYRTKAPALDLSLGLWLPPRSPRLDITLAIKPLSFFAETERCHPFVSMVRAWASRYPVPYSVAHSIDDLELADFPSFGRDDETRRRDGFDRIYEVCWLNVFGPQLVERVGRERMLSTPAHRVEELPNGGVLLVTWPTLADFASAPARQAQARAHVHLRPDLEYDAVLRTLHERSATLAPVEPRFPPDLAPLLFRVVDTVPSPQRQRRIAELNAWRPPESGEWLPAASAEPSDVDEPAHALALYATLAEHLVALVHAEVPSVFEGAPESLTDLDFYFWREDFPSTRSRQAIDETAVYAVGAYLGQLLVRHLGGQWIPRRQLLESQVLVGQRVWLPFLRARHLLRSRQALLDCSLTGLYREAERYRA